MYLVKAQFAPTRLCAYIFLSKLLSNKGNEAAVIKSTPLMPLHLNAREPLGESVLQPAWRQCKAGCRVCTLPSVLILLFKDLLNKMILGITNSSYLIYKDT